MVNENGKSAAGNREFDETCERYLLGELPESEREQFEEDYFTDSDFFERYLSVKEELLDLCARGELPKEKHARFNKRFQASPSLKQKVAETKDFIRTMTLVSAKAQGADLEVRNTQPKQFWQSLVDSFKFRKFAWAGGGLLALLLIAAIGTWFNLKNRDLDLARNVSIIHQKNRNSETDRQATSAPSDVPLTDKNNNVAPMPTSRNANPVPRRDNPAPDNTNQVTANIKQPPVNTKVTPQPTPTKPVEQPSQIPQTQVASILLSPFASRNTGEKNTLRLSPETQTARLEFNFKTDDLRDYSATITTVAGVKIFEKEKLPVMVFRSGTFGASKSVSLQIPAAQFRQQDYIVTLKVRTASGKTETIAEYYFNVERVLTITPKPKP